MKPLLSVALAVAVCVAPVVAARAEESSFIANEMQAAAARDLFKRIRGTFDENDPRSVVLVRQTSDAFIGAEDQTETSNAYYALRTPFLKKVADLEERVESALARNNLEDAARVRKALKAAYRDVEDLRSEFEFYVRLPPLAVSEQGEAARATMRVLAQSRDFHVALAYYVARGKALRIPPQLPPSVFLLRRR